MNKPTHRIKPGAPCFVEYVKEPRAVKTPLGYRAVGPGDVLVTPADGGAPMVCDVSSVDQMLEPITGIAFDDQGPDAPKPGWKPKF